MPGPSVDSKGESRQVSVMMSILLPAPLCMAASPQVEFGSIPHHGQEARYVQGFNHKIMGK